MNVPAIAVATGVAIVGLAVVAGNFFASAQAERRQLRSDLPNPHWRAEAAIDLFSGLVLAFAAVVIIAAVLH